MISHSCAESPARSASVGDDVESAVLARLQRSELWRDYRAAFEAITGLPLVLRAAGSFRTPLQGSKQLNPFCALMVRANKTCSACLQLQQRVEQEASWVPKTLTCYAGLNESAVPVRLGERVLGYLQTGQVFFRKPAKARFAAISPLLPGGEAGVDRRELEAAFFRTRVVPREKYDSILRLLAIFAEHLATVCNRLLIAETTVEPPVVTRGRTFIQLHQCEEVSLGDVARALNMSAFHFCKVFKKATGLTFTQYLSRVRIESVKETLLNANTRVSEAAYAAGFQSLSQFNRVFRRIVGETPGHYRDRLHGLNCKSSHPSTVVRAA